MYKLCKKYKKTTLLRSQLRRPCYALSKDIYSVLRDISYRQQLENHSTLDNRYILFFFNQIKRNFTPVLLHEWQMRKKRAYLTLETLATVPVKYLKESQFLQIHKPQ